MNTIKIYDGDMTKIFDYKDDHYFDRFVFDEFKVIRESEDCKMVYRVNINNGVNEIKYMTIKDGVSKKCEFSFTENEEGEVNFIESPKGDYINSYILNSMKHGKLSKVAMKELKSNLERYFTLEAIFISELKQYIMNESYKRSRIQKESTRAGSAESGGSRTIRKVAVKPVEQFLLGDIVEYVSSNRRKLHITCECWDVRGHFRKYKDGKVVWINSYEKGKQRNTGHAVRNHTYVI